MAHGEALVWAIGPAGRMVSVDDVDRGRACGCFCPAPGCAAPVLARKGERNRWHFAHADGLICDAAPESALHRLAKEIVACGPLRLPAYLAAGRVLIPEGEWEVDSAEVEAPMGRLRIDALARVRGALAPLAVEIRVAHAVGRTKAEAFRWFGMSALEVDLSKTPRDSARAQVEDAVRSSAPRSWIHNRRGEDLRRRMAEEDEKEAGRRSLTMGEEALRRSEAAALGADRAAWRDARRWVEAEDAALAGALWPEEVPIDPRALADPMFQALLSSKAMRRIQGVHQFQAAPPTWISEIHAFCLSAEGDPGIGTAFQSQDLAHPPRSRFPCGVSEAVGTRVSALGREPIPPMDAVESALRLLTRLGRLVPIVPAAGPGARSSVPHLSECLSHCDLAASSPRWGWMVLDASGREALAAVRSRVLGPSPSPASVRAFASHLASTLTAPGRRRLRPNWIGDVARGVLSVEEAVCRTLGSIGSERERGGGGERGSER